MVFEVSILRSKMGRVGSHRLALTVLASAWLLGGASRFDVLAPFVVSSVALVVLAVLVGTGRAAPLSRGERWCWGLLLAVFLLQLIPLPPALWTLFPGHSFPREIFAVIGAEPWLPWSLTPSRTFASLFALFPPLAVYLAAKGLTRQEGDRLLAWLVGFAVVSALLGLLQLAGGPNTALRFYAITNRDAAVGFFSNANHFGVWLACCVPAAVYLALQLTDQDSRGANRTIAITGAGVIALLAAGSVASLSRAAFGAILVTILFAGGAFIARARLTPKVKIVAAAAPLILLGAVIAAFVQSGWFERIAEVSELGEKGRLEMVPIFAQMIADTLPLGTGIGSFDAVHRGYEDYQVLGSTYLNNAHNDLAQILIEAGILAAIVLIAWLILIVDRSLAALRNPAQMDAGDLGVIRALALILPIFILLGHSLVDYPLRASAAAATFVLFVALLAGARRKTV